MSLLLVTCSGRRGYEWSFSDAPVLGRIDFQHAFVQVPQEEPLGLRLGTTEIQDEERALTVHILPQNGPEQPKKPQASQNQIRNYRKPMIGRSRGSQESWTDQVYRDKKEARSV